jgi:hypothetical protein
MHRTSIVVGLVLFSLAGSAMARNDAPVAEPVADAKPAEPAAEVAPASPAEEATAVKLTIGVDAAAQTPVSSNFRKQNALGLGGLMRVELTLIPRLNLTLRGGYIYGLKHHLKDTFQDVDYKTSTLPIWIGGKYFVTDMIYGAVEAGYNRLTWSYDGTLAGVPSHNSGTGNKYGGTVGAGVLLIGRLDVKAQLEVLDIGHAGDTMAIMVNVGYDFLRLP